MPSDKKRVNLTVPDEIYEELQEFKLENGITNDASACLQLIVQQLKSQKNAKVMLKMMSETSMEQLMQISQEGFSYVKDELSKKELPPA